jgi:hypothetical protein
MQFFPKSIIMQHLAAYTSLCAILICHLSWANPLGNAASVGRRLAPHSSSTSISSPSRTAQPPFYTPDGDAWKDLPPGTILKNWTISVPTVGNSTGTENIQYAYQLL